MNDMDQQSGEPENFLEGIKQNDQRFRDEYDGLEAIIEGDVGFHAYFTEGGPDVTRGALTAIYQGIYDVLDEVSIDQEIVEHRHGEATPEAVREEVMSQLDEYAYFPENLRESIGDRVEERVEKNIRAQSEAEA